MDKIHAALIAVAITQAITIAIIFIIWYQVIEMINKMESKRTEAKPRQIKAELVQELRTDPGETITVSEMMEQMIVQSIRQGAHARPPRPPGPTTPDHGEK